jgi:ABC-type Na+ efflux pump permease subunit
MTEDQKSGVTAIRPEMAGEITAVSHGRDWVGYSPARVWTIALNTFIESVRQKVYNILLVLGLLLIPAALFFRQFNFAGEQLKFLQDFCLGAITVVGTLIAIVGTAQLLPNEVENRTIYTILAKPVRRIEFLLGKYFGSLLLIVVSVLLMSLMFLAVLVVMERSMVAEVRLHGPDYMDMTTEEAIERIRAETYNPDLVKGLSLTVVKLSLLAAITLLFSTFSTSMVFNVVMAVFVLIAGHLRGPAVEMWSEQRLLMMVLAVIPDFGTFNLADDIILGKEIPWRHALTVGFYGVVRTAFVVLAAHLIFSKREI